MQFIIQPWIAPQAGCFFLWYPHGTKDGANLYVEYETLDLGPLDETHLAVGANLLDTPQKNGSSILWQVPKK